jgi:riboflavin biosynthesis pyrimidine reductase
MLVGGETVCIDCPNLKSENEKEAAVVAVVVDEVCVGPDSGVNELR